MHRTARRTILALETACAAVGLCRPARAGATVTFSATTTHGTTSVRVVVAGLSGGTRWKALRLLAARKAKFPTLEGRTPTSTTVTDGNPAHDQTWKVELAAAGSEVHVYADGATPAGFSDGTYAFELDFADDDATQLLPITWEAAATRAPARDDVPVLDDAAGQSASVPQLPIAANNAHPLVTPIGATCPCPCTASPSMAGTSWEVYTSQSLDPDGSDALGLGIRTGTDPVPARWGLTFRDVTGVLSSRGTADPQPRVTTPDDPTLVGRTYYLVFVLKSDSGAVRYASDPVEVRISKP